VDHCSLECLGIHAAKPGTRFEALEPIHQGVRHSFGAFGPNVAQEVKRRADVVGIFPNEASIIRLIGAVLLEQNDEWQLQHRYMQAEAMAESTPELNASSLLEIPPRAA